MFSKQWGDDISNQVEGNESSRYVEWDKDVAEFQTGTGFSKDGTGARFEASAVEVQGDAGYYVNPLTGVKGQAGAEANLVSLRGDAGVGKDLGELGLDKVEGKIYGGVHGEALVGAILGVGAALGGKVALEDGKLTIGAKAKGALGVGLGFEGGATIDFKKVGKTVENIVGKETTAKVTEGVKDVAKDVGNGIKNVFSGLF